MIATISFILDVPGDLPDPQAPPQPCSIKNKRDSDNVEPDNNNNNNNNNDDNNNNNNNNSNNNNNNNKNNNNYIIIMIAMIIKITIIKTQINKGI